MNTDPCEHNEDSPCECEKSVTDTSGETVTIK